MPIYEYRCETGHTFEVMQRMSDDTLETCPEDGAPVQRVFHPVAIHFKGKGFYNTDYGKKTRGAEPVKTSSNESNSDSKPKADSKPKSDSKPASGSADS